jgi:hypothetical protein
VIVAMKKKMEDHSSHLVRGGQSFIEIIMFMRENADRRSSARHKEDEVRRREDQLERELTIRREREERDQRRREEKLKAEERPRGSFPTYSGANPAAQYHDKEVNFTAHARVESHAIAGPDAELR